MNYISARWQLTAGDPAKEAALRRALGISAPLARILVGRGIDTTEAAAEFFDFSWERVPSPWLLADMEPASRRLAEAVKKKEPITVYGDYDVDGVTAAALLVQVIGELGGRAMYYIPHRAEEGYGLHQEALAEIKGQSRLVVTVDCGISAAAEAEYALEQGMELVITDHHQPGRELPKAVAVVNPNRPDCSYPTKELAGVGVAFKLAQAVARLLTGNDQQGDDLVKKYLDLVALGTVADVVPLIGENRILVHMGLENFGQRSVGLTALMEVAGLASRDISTGNLAFGLAPRINALGRLDDAAAAVRLLLTDDAQEARRLAQVLDDANQQRRAIEDQVTEEAAAMVEAEVDLDKEWTLVLASPDWHPGVIGIAASRLVERYHRPTILISLEEEPGKGSGRSIDGFDLHRALETLSPLFERFGGHKMAAGLTIRREMIPKLRRELNKLAQSVLTKEDLVPTIRIDAQVTLDEIDMALLEDLERLAPYGVGNPTPVLAAKSLALRKGFTVGKDRSHLKLFVSSGGEGPGAGLEFSAVGFRMGGRLGQVEGAARVDLAFQPKLNVWNGQTNIELYLKDVKLPPEEARQQLFLQSLQDYVKVHGSRRQAGREKMVPTSMPAAFPGRVFDWRSQETKGAVFQELSAKAGAALLYAGEPRHAAALAEGLTESSFYRGRVGLYHGLMAPEECLTLKEMLKEGKLALVITAEPVDDELQKSFARLVLYQLPLTPKDFHWAWSFSGPELYLAYTAKDLDRNQSLWSRLYPARDQLVQLYLMMGRQGTSGQVEVSRSWCSERALNLEWQGICLGLRVFLDLGLIEAEGTSIWEKADSIRVRLLPAPKNKLDLTRSISYNECVKWRAYLDSYGQWALETPVSRFQEQDAWKIVLGA